MGVLTTVLTVLGGMGGCISHCSHGPGRLGGSVLTTVLTVLRGKGGRINHCSHGPERQREAMLGVYRGYT